MDFATRFTKAREFAGFNKTELAGMIRVSASAVGQIESGETKSMRPENLFLAAEVMGVDAKWLATGKGTPPGLHVGESEAHYGNRIDSEVLAAALELAEAVPRRDWNRASHEQRARWLGMLYELCIDESARNIAPATVVRLLRSA